MLPAPGVHDLIFGNNLEKRLGALLKVGLFIHHFLSPQAADRLRGITTWRDVRDREKPSDHVPVVIELED